MPSVHTIAENLNLNILAGRAGLNKEVKGAYAADLLSDVMGKAEEGQLWITLQAHTNVIAIASLKDLAGIILVNGIKPDADMIEQAEKQGIPVLGTTEGTFNTAGKLYSILEK